MELTGLTPDPNDVGDQKPFNHQIESFSAL